MEGGTSNIERPTSNIEVEENEKAASALAFSAVGRRGSRRRINSLDSGYF
jgi:hypothetical protein